MIWSKKSLSEVCEIKPPKAQVKELLSEEDYVAFVPMNNLGINQKHFTYEINKKLKDVYGSYTYFSDEDVLLAKITPCFENGKLGIAKNLKNGIGFGSSEYIVFRTSSDIDSEYLYYHLSQDSFREKGKRVMTGAVGHKRVPKEFIEEYQIPIPSVKEQKRIVATIENTFEKIEQARTKAEKNLQNARELFENSLFFIINKAEKYGAEKKVGDVCELFQGLCINSKTKHLLVKKSKLPLLRIKDLRSNSEEQYIAESGFPEKSLVSKNDIIYTRTGQIGLVFRGRQGVLHNNCFRVEPDKTIKKNYIYWWLQYPGFRNRVIELASRAAQPDITHKIFKSQEIIVPFIKNQEIAVKKIEAVYSDTQKLIDVYKDKLNYIDELKKSILQKAFSGELH